MKLLFLRGQVPQDRNPKQIMFNHLEDVDDLWTQLACALTGEDYGEVWYWGGKRFKEYKSNFAERWMPDFKIGKYDRDPDVIFARGGFPEYDQVLKRFPKAYKIYYGAGKRFYPQSKFKNYDLIINDTKGQVKKTSKLFPKSKVIRWVKPAAENIFKPVEAEKEYDVIMVANESPKKDIKGHGFAFKHVPKDLKMLKAGIALKKSRNRHPHVDFTGWIPRRLLPELYAKSKVAIVCCTTIDSCPRVIPEALACDCPLLILDRINFWHDKYISEKSGKLCNEENFSQELKNMVANYDKFSAYEHYKEHLSLDKCVETISSYVNNKHL